MRRATINGFPHYLTFCGMLWRVRFGRIGQVVQHSIAMVDTVHTDVYGGCEDALMSELCVNVSSLLVAEGLAV